MRTRIFYVRPSAGCGLCVRAASWDRDPAGGSTTTSTIAHNTNRSWQCSDALVLQRGQSSDFRAFVRPELQHHKAAEMSFLRRGNSCVTPDMEIRKRLEVSLKILFSSFWSCVFRNFLVNLRYEDISTRQTKTGTEVWRRRSGTMFSTLLECPRLSKS